MRSVPANGWAYVLAVTAMVESESQGVSNRSKGDGINDCCGRKAIVDRLMTILLLGLVQLKVDSS